MAHLQSQDWGEQVQAAPEYDEKDLMLDNDEIFFIVTNMEDFGSEIYAVFLVKI